MDYETILLERKDRITTITLNRPEKLNALNPRMMAELLDAFYYVDKDDETRAVIITGNGRGFCSGADIKEGMQGRIDPDQGKGSNDITREGFPQKAPLALTEMRKPVIAAINGLAIGGGCTLTLCCDIRIAADTAKFSVPLTRMGFTFELGSSYFLSRLIGIGKASELVFTGRMIDADEAREIGLVNKVVPADKLIETAHEMANDILKAVPLATSITKRGLYQGMNEDLVTQLRWEALALKYLSGTEDQREAIRAFAEKREPEFKGR